MGKLMTALIIGWVALLAITITVFVGVTKKISDEVEKQGLKGIFEEVWEGSKE